MNEPFGSLTTASGISSHAEGQYSIASGLYSHAEGMIVYCDYCGKIGYVEYLLNRPICGSCTEKIKKDDRLFTVVKLMLKEL